ncbi:hypothetical protein Tco_0007342 [Tanacetum coccineum]
MLHNKELPKDCYKVSIDTSLVDAECIPDVGNNAFKTVKDAVGHFFAWPKDLVVFDPKILGELEVMADEQMVVPAVDEIAEKMVVHAVEEVDEPVAEAEKEPMIAPVVDIGEGQMDAPMMDMEEDLAALFDDDDFEDDASDGFGEEEV